MKKDIQELRIRIPRQDHELRLIFLDNRDFLVSLCILRKSGFIIGNSPASEPVTEEVTAKHKTVSERTPKVDAPCLSFRMSTATLPAQAITLMKSNVRDEDLASPASLPITEQFVSNGGDMSYFNQHKIFIESNRTGQSMPRASSPLRGSVESYQDKQNKRTARVTSPEEERTSVLAYKGELSSRQKMRPRAVSMSGHHSNRDMSDQVDLDRREGFDTIIPDLIKNHSKKKNLTRSSTSPITNANFRELMPRRRNLPFISGGYPSTKDLTKGTNRSYYGLARIQKSSKIRQSRQHPTARWYKNAAVVFDTVRTSSKSPCTEDESVSPGTQDNRTNSPESCTSAEFMSPVVFMDQHLLRQSLHLGSEILDQYRADLSRGRPGLECSDFYLQQLQSARTSFWVQQLSEMKCVMQVKE